MNLTDHVLEARNQIVERVGDQTFTRGELDEAFSKVQPANWKDAIDAIVELNSPRELLALGLAVPFFTGSVARIVRIDEGGNRFRVTAAGYYATIGA